MLISDSLKEYPIVLRSYAKVAPYLDVIEPKANGLWDSQSIIFPIDLYDLIHIRLTSQSGISILCDNPHVVTNQENTCFKAAQLILNNSNKMDQGVEILIEKRIPVSAGLGGGSSNATAVLIALNILLELNWDITKIAKYALMIGNDCYFFCFLQSCYIDNAHFTVVPLPIPTKKLKFAIVDPQIPHIPNKTRTVFSRIKSAGQRKTIAPTFFYACLLNDGNLLQDNCYNFIKPTLMPEYAKAFEIQAHVRSQLDLNLVFTGSGPFLTLPFFGDSIRKLEEICECLGANVFYASLLGCTSI